MDDVTHPPAGVHAKPSDPQVKSIIKTLIQFEEYQYGTLSLSYTAVRRFNQEDRKFIEGLAQQLAITIHRLEA